jgi:hypothetical protein
MKKILKSLVALAFVSLLFLPVVTFAADPLNLTDTGYDFINNDIKLGSNDPRSMVATIINTAMMFLGIIAVVIMLVGGFKWMTAMGNEKGIEEAKKLMGAGVIGLVIILASWGIATFVLQQLINATQGTA